MTAASMLTFFLILLCVVNIIHAQQVHPPPAPTGHQSVTCHPFGACEPCPQDALHEPFCHPFGNRQLMHCSNTTTTTPTIPTDYPYPTSPPSEAPGSLGETPAWQPCGRIPAQERADFYEFVACNMLFAAAAIGVALIRSRRIEAHQARRLAARIGLVRGGG
ncbi:hypothetical protein K503DRAFT_737153 [Rhizopogon vinicolor AM-OR11-026]|uniref:Uncharacterized protein n=1 Tax=Rhizopogon vinicolor AM-OR11-026 TaxID=1314800 RepID=A0A1B7N6Y0_9AGAM|nr:hypothetical protein K503DRAFT_737153 [Rhizopogon vinicolor AM-OR11-026]